MADLGTTPRVAAVDWSGARTGARRKIWLAVARPLDGAREPAPILELLENGRTREELVEHLIELAAEPPGLVVGLDFAFAFPAWFARERSCSRAREVWDLVAREGERWLAECEPPFWGRPGRKCPAHDGARPRFRATEGSTRPERGIAAKSVFQIGGAGAVGTGSLRGMPFLARLADAGFAIWPFDAPRLPLAIEIYPRQLTGPVNKSSRSSRALHLAEHAQNETRATIELASSSEDAFDACMSALAMRAATRELLVLERARDEDELLEGRIWRPRAVEAVAGFR